jgi:beta-lactam-binding protein with PASTA domain
MGMQGWHRDFWIAEDGSVVRQTQRAQNRIVHRGLDLMGDLLVGRPGNVGLLWFAMGGGDPAWDARPPSPSETSTTLHHELFRLPLAAVHFTLDTAQRSITIRVSVPPALITETVREFGVFGGNATALRDTGYLFSYRIHPAVQRPVTTSLLRELVLQFHIPNLTDDGWLAMAQLLTNQLDRASIGWWVEGSGDAAWDSTPPAFDPKTATLRMEVYRTALQAPHLLYDGHTHTVIARVDLEMDQAPSTLRETGLFTTGARPKLVAYRTYTALDKRRPQHLHREFRLELAGDTNVTVPNLAGLDLGAAQESLSDVDLVADPILQRDDNVNAGKVVAFSPPAGTVVPSRSRVSVTMGATPRVVVPNVIGLTPADAVTVLTGRSLVAGDGGKDIVLLLGIPGSIVRQSPMPGVLATQGSTVMLTLGIARTVTVPDLTGLTPVQAVLALQAADLLASATPFPTEESDAEAGTIISQKPKPNQTADRHSDVQFTLATVRTLEVPDLSGQTMADAEQLVKAAADAAAKALGREAPIPWLSIGERAEEDSNAPQGTITRQSPAAKAQAPLYTAVRVVISQPAPVSTPDITGLKKDLVSSKLAASKLRLGKLTEQPSALPEGTVISQEPLPGLPVAAGSNVDVIIAALILVAVPDLFELSIGAGGELVKGAGLVYGTPIPGIATSRPGTIISQTPAVGSLVALGTVVTVTALIPTTVPNVVGMQRADAINQLQNAGLTSTTVLQLSEQPVGNVLDQNPIGGAQALRSSSVVISVAQGQSVPNLVGIASALVSDIVGPLHLSSDSTTQLSEKPLGMVIGQSPAPGTEVPLRTLIHVVIAAGVAVPNVVNMNPAAATATLANVSLVIKITNQGTIVINQDPAAGTVVPLNTEVNVFLRMTGVTVPNVVDLTPDAAKSVLMTVNLQMTTIGTGNVVVAQDPVGGRVVGPGTVVTVTLGDRVGITVPDVTNQPSDRAISILQNAALQGAVTAQAFSTKPSGTVLRQDPVAGSVVARGTTVGLTISSTLRPPIG